MEPAQSDAASARANSKSPGPLPGKQPDQSMLPPMPGEALNPEQVSRYEPLRAASNLPRRMPPRRFVDPCHSALGPRPLRCRGSQTIILATAASTSLHGPACRWTRPAPLCVTYAWACLHSQAKTAAKAKHAPSATTWTTWKHPPHSCKKAPPTGATARPYRPLHAHALAVSCLYHTTPTSVACPECNPDGPCHPDMVPFFRQAVHPGPSSGASGASGASAHPSFRDNGLRLEALPKRHEPRLVDGWWGWQRVAVCSSCGVRCFTPG